jgi:ATP-binding cassette subfamily B protein
MSAATPGPGRSGLELILEEEALGKAIDRKLLGRLWQHVNPYRWQVAATLLLVGPMFLLEITPAWLLKTGLDRLAGAENPGGAVGAWLEPPGGLSPWVWLPSLFLLVGVLRAGVEYAQMLLLAATGQAAMRDPRMTVFDHIQRLHQGFFDRYPVGRLVTRCSSDVEHVAEMFSAGLVLLVTDLLRMIGFATVLFIIAPDLAAVTFAVVPLLAAAAFIFRLKVRNAFRVTRVLLARINATIQETVTGMKVVQLFRREARNQRDFERLNAEHKDAWKTSIRYDSALFSVVELAAGVTTAAVLWAATSATTAGTIYVFMDYMRRFFLPLRDLSAKYSVMQSSMASLERIFQLLDTEPAVLDAPAEAAAQVPLGITQAFDALAATGALEPREPQPSDALTSARSAVSRLVNAWDDALADSVAAMNLFLDESKDRWRTRMIALQGDVGACTNDGPFLVENALRGRWRMRCASGTVEVAITLAPTIPPKVQYLNVRRVDPMTPLRAPPSCPAG